MSEPSNNSLFTPKNIVRSILILWTALGCVTTCLLMRSVWTGVPVQIGFNIK